MSKFQKLKKEAWQYYQTWMKEKTVCRALNREVIISRKGWDHIFTGSKIHKRMIKDKINRLNLLKQAKYIIKNIEHSRKEIRNGQSFIILESKNIWSRNGRIKVILKIDKAGILYFHSVMTNKK